MANINGLITLVNRLGRLRHSFTTSKRHSHTAPFWIINTKAADSVEQYGPCRQKITTTTTGTRRTDMQRLSTAVHPEPHTHRLGGLTGGRASSCVVLIWVVGAHGIESGGGMTTHLHRRNCAINHRSSNRNLQR